ncbi:hypothetical protein scyTo_0000286 [Scyliorhinus torazame]|uniref:Uncharacterized protein n=1 Tax=Scyliorhinus torazame TaxID=75743 RepID=A0A401NUF7_SCYTO|nr:hypothetical protein [Scyliorhinus torazame]
MRTWGVVDGVKEREGRPGGEGRHEGEGEERRDHNTSEEVVSQFDIGASGVELVPRESFGSLACGNYMTRVDRISAASSDCEFKFRSHSVASQ